MSKLTKLPVLIFFEGCPKYVSAKKMLDEIDIRYELVCQDSLDPDDPLMNYSSPTLLADGKIIFGSKVEGGGCSVSLPSKEELTKMLKG